MFWVHFSNLLYISKRDNVIYFSSAQGNHLAVATYRGRVHIWDVAAGQCLRRLEGHLARVGALAWNSDLLASGSRDRQIFLRDVRASPTSGGGPTHTPLIMNHSGRTPTPTDLQQPHTPPPPSSSPYRHNLVSIDREILANSTRASIFPSSSAAGSGIVTHPLIPNDVNSCPGSIRILKDHRQEVC